MKIVVLAQDYPSSSKPYAMAYVHSRNLEYIKDGHNVVVINFTTEENYIFEGIPVRRYNYSLLSQADIILSHAPNLKNHFRVLTKLKNRTIVFFFHGHEVLKRHGDYPEPYEWINTNNLRIKAETIYDIFKLKSIKPLLKLISYNNNIGFIFVSEWMKDKFVENLCINPKLLGPIDIIPNSCNSIFYTRSYIYDKKNAMADFITIRPLNGSKYAIDLVVNFAIKNPKKTFHIYGKGDFFKYIKTPDNVKVFDSFVQQKDIPSLLNKYKCALMPTRYDAQGVMSCEMATYGIPLITTTFPVCIEMLSSFSNVLFLDETQFSEKLDVLPIPSNPVVNNKFCPNILINKELGFFEQV